MSSTQENHPKIFIDDVTLIFNEFWRFQRHVLLEGNNIRQHFYTVVHPAKGFRQITKVTVSGLEVYRK